jgi:hypothetical protein
VRQATYRQLFRAQLSHADLESIRETLHKGWALGSHRFRAKIETLSARRASPLPKGRPRQKDNGVRPCLFSADLYTRRLRLAQDADDPIIINYHCTLPRRQPSTVAEKARSSSFLFGSFFICPFDST